MRIAVDTIPRTGRQVSLDLQTDWVREAASAALDAGPTSLAGRAELTPPGRDGRVTVSVGVQLAADVPCGRCGEPFRFELATEASLDYVPVPGSPEEGEVELEETELDVGWYTGGELDMGDVLREVIALAVPPRYTCADRSACDRRTEALLAQAREGEAPGHPGFAVLKNLKN